MTRLAPAPGSSIGFRGVPAPHVDALRLHRERHRGDDAPRSTVMPARALLGTPVTTSIVPSGVEPQTCSEVFPLPVCRQTIAIPRPRPAGSRSSRTRSRGAALRARRTPIGSRTGFAGQRGLPVADHVAASGTRAGRCRGRARSCRRAVPRRRRSARRRASACARPERCWCRRPSCRASTLGTRYGTVRVPGAGQDRRSVCRPPNAPPS